MSGIGYVRVQQVGHIDLQKPRRSIEFIAMHSLAKKKNFTEYVRCTIARECIVQGRGVKIKPSNGFFGVTFMYPGIRAALKSYS